MTELNSALEPDAAETPRPGQSQISNKSTSKKPTGKKSTGKNPALEICVALILSMVIVIDCISMAALVFPGELAEHLPLGIGIFLISSIIIGLVVGLKSTFKSNIASPKSIAGAIFALIATSAYTSLKGPEVLPTILFTIAFTTFLTGIFFFMVGWLKLGKLTRFIPYPVIGGFLAGMGWLIVEGSFSVLTGLSLSFEEIKPLFEPVIFKQWIPGFLFAALLLGFERKFKHFLLVPVMIFLFMVTFFIFLWATGTSLGQASESGWLLGPFPGGMLWEPLDIAMISSVNWEFVRGEAGRILAIVLLCTLAVLLNYTGLEISTGQEFDLDRELRATGTGNMAASLFGGSIGFNSPAFCMLNYKSGAQTRIAVIVIPLVCAAALLYGASAFAYFPRALVGGFLMSLGLGLLIRWLYDSRAQLTGLDYALVVAILVIIASWGFLEGFMVGVMFAIIIFIFNYSRIEVVKHSLSGSNFRSNVERSLLKQKVLSERGRLIRVLKLQGYIFFGTANSIYTQVKEHMSEQDQTRPGYIILDFHAVSGIDSSAIMSFDKIKRLTGEKHAWFVLSGLSPRLEGLLNKSGFLVDPGDSMLFGLDLDHAMEWCENRILSEYGALKQETIQVSSYLSEFLPVPEDIEIFMAYMKRLKVPEDYVLIKQGDSPEEMYFIEHGQAGVYLEMEDGTRKRLRSVGSGALVGEMGVFSGSPRSATVVTSYPSVVYSLDAGALNLMQEQHPGILRCFHEFILKQLVRRLAYSNKMLDILLK